jgi:hypothetical protein
MGPIRTIMTTLLVTGLASLGYAQPPAPVAAQKFSALSLGLAIGPTPQQDEQKPKDRPDSKPPNPAKQDEKPAKQQEPNKSQAQDKPQTQKPKDQKQDKNKNLAKQNQNNEDKGHQAAGGRIPDKDLKAHFGQEHKFNVRQVVTTTTIVPNQTQFVYTGYTFVFADPWPAGWAMDDDCYIDYVDGGYYLVDVVHPGVRIALTIVG